MKDGRVHDAMQRRKVLLVDEPLHRLVCLLSRARSTAQSGPRVSSVSSANSGQETHDS